MKFDFDVIKKSVTKAAIKTKETSENMVEIAKLKYKLAELKSDVEENYIKIGKLVYNAEENDDISEALKDICAEIEQQTEKISDMQDNLNELLNKKQCPECNTKFDKEFDFCPKCGYKFDIEAE